LLGDEHDEHPSIPVIFHEVFTDGSGYKRYKPTDPRLRVATWGTVIWDGNSFIPLSQGGLPGRLQTVHRAEITLSLKPIRIWTDKKNVYDILVALWATTEVDISRKADRDLWDRLLHQWRLSKHAVAGGFKRTSACRSKHPKMPHRNMGGFGK